MNIRHKEYTLSLFLSYDKQVALGKNKGKRERIKSLLNKVAKIVESL